MADLPVEFDTPQDHLDILRSFEICLSAFDTPAMRAAVRRRAVLESARSRSARGTGQPGPPWQQETPTSIFGT